MEHKKGAQRSRIIEHVLDIPGKILSLHGQDNIAEFVLQTLCHDECFNLTKAAYFIDNPDFNHFQGIVGYSAQESFNHHPHSCWENPQAFGHHMKKAPFNQRVRGLQSLSPKKKDQHNDHLVKNIANELELINPQFCGLNLKNDNHGLFIFEEGAGTGEWKTEDLKRALCLLGFCPVF